MLPPPMYGTRPVVVLAPKLITRPARLEDWTPLLQNISLLLGIAVAIKSLSR